MRTQTAIANITILCIIAGGINVVANKESSGYSIYIEAAQPRDMVLHWAVNDWEAPPMDNVPPGTHKVGKLRFYMCILSSSMRFTDCLWWISHLALVSVMFLQGAGQLLQHMHRLHT